MPFPGLMTSPRERVAMEEGAKTDRLKGLKASFSGELMTHNIQIAVLTMASGITWGVGTFVLLFYNGVTLERFRQQRIVEIGEKDQQGAPPQVHLQGGKHLAKIGADAGRPQVVNGFAAEPEVRQAASGAYQVVGAIAEGDQAEAVSLAFGRERQVQAGVHVVVEHVFPRRQPRKIHDGVDLLRVLDLIELDHRKAPPSRRLPVNVFEIIARQVMAQVVKLAAFPDLAARAQADFGGFQQQHRSLPVSKVRIHAKRASERSAGARLPQAERRHCLQVDLADRMGAVAADYVTAGQGTFLAGWLLPHGSVEIPAILLGGQAGFVLAGALLGWRSRQPRAVRLREAAHDLLALVAGAAGMLVWAGLIEAFVSQYHQPVLPYALKIAFGLCELAALAAFLGWAGRE